MNSLKEDKRIRRTKKLLKEAFIDLLKEKEFEKITVTDIIGKADFNRATFYNHYLDKFDLVKEIETELLDQFLEAIRSTYKDENHLHLKKLSPKDLFIFDYIYDKKDYFILWKYHSDIPNFRSKFFTVFVYFFKGDLKIKYKSDTTLDEDDLTYFIASGIMGMIMEWINDDFKETPYNMSVKTLEILNLFTITGTEVNLLKDLDSSNITPKDYI